MRRRHLDGLAGELLAKEVVVVAARDGGRDRGPVRSAPLYTLRMFRGRGARAYPLVPEGDRFYGEPACARFADLPERPQALVLFARTPWREWIPAAAAAGATHLWLSLGAGLRASLDLAREHGLVTVISCPLMYMDRQTAWAPFCRLHAETWRRWGLPGYAPRSPT